MVAKHSPSGLIATMRSALTPLLDELAMHCSWPVVLEATPRRLRHELTAYSPECVVFWLDQREAIEPTARLIAWARQRGPRPLRLAVACDMDADVESMLRAAGAHGFLPLVGSSAAPVVEALGPLVQDALRTAAPTSTTPAGTRGHPHFTAKSAADLVRPP